MAKSNQNVKSDIRWEINGLLLICFGVLGIFSIYTNAVGAIGNFISKNFKGFSGQAAVLIPVLIILAGVYCLYYKKKPNISFRIIGLIVIFTVVVFLFHLKTHATLLEINFMDRLRKSADMGVEGIGGGILGETGLSLLISIFGTTGSTILMITFIIIGTILTTGKSLTVVIKKIKLPTKSKNIPINPPIKSENIKVVNNTMTDILSTHDNNDIETEKTAVLEKQETKQTKMSSKEETDKDPIIISSDTEEEKTYKLPPVSLLRKNTMKQSGFSEKELLNNAQILESTLESFGLQAKVIQVNCGPAITRFEIQPSPGIKVSRIVNLADDIALSLAASDVRIEAPIPGKAAIGIEVPNKKKSPVYLRDVLESPEFNASASKLTIALGKDIGGNSMVTDFDCRGNRIGQECLYQYHNIQYFI